MAGKADVSLPLLWLLLLAWLSLRRLAYPLV